MVRIGNYEEVLVLNIDGTLYALNNICPHASAALERGDVIDGILYCPLHRWGFELATGVCIDEETLRAQTYAIETSGCDLWLRSP